MLYSGLCSSHWSQLNLLIMFNVALSLVPSFLWLYMIAQTALFLWILLASFLQFEMHHQTFRLEVGIPEVLILQVQLHHQTFWLEIGVPNIFIFAGWGVSSDFLTWNWSSRNLTFCRLTCIFRLFDLKMEFQKTSFLQVEVHQQTFWVKIGHPKNFISAGWGEPSVFLT